MARIIDKPLVGALHLRLPIKDKANTTVRDTDRCTDDVTLIDVAYPDQMAECIMTHD